MPRGRKPKSQTTAQNQPQDNINNININDFSNTKLDPSVSAALNYGLLSQMGNQNWFNNPIWMNELLKQMSTISRKYKRDDVLKWLENYQQHEKELNELNQYLLVSSQHFRRLVDYFIEMSMFTPLLYPSDTDLTESEMNSPAFKKSEKRAYDFLEKFSCDDEGKKVMRTALEEDVGYYYKRENGDKITFQRLPTQWCKLVSRNDTTFNVAFNFMFFWRLGINLKDYPPEFTQYIMDIEEGKRKDNTYAYWVILDPEKAVAFKFHEDTGVIKSPWLGLFLDILEISEFKNLIKSRAVLDNFLLLTQKIPMGKDDKKNNFLIEMETAGKFQQLISQAIPQGVKLVTTPMDITATKLDGAGSSNRESIVGEGESSFYKASGVAPALFGASDNKNVGIVQSIKVDETWIFRFYRQLERWINFQLRLSTGAYRFKVKFPDITYFNYKDKFDMYIQSAQSGYCKSLVNCALGLTPLQARNLNMYENARGFVDNMKVLPSSHTQAGLEGKGGAPTKSEDKLTNSGIETRNTGSNLNSDD